MNSVTRPYQVCDLSTGEIRDIQIGDRETWGTFIDPGTPRNQSVADRARWDNVPTSPTVQLIPFGSPRLERPRAD